MPKRLSRAQRTGKVGELIAELAVFETLGFTFHPSGDLETGTDGFLEVCDPGTGSPSGRYIAVQVKATDGQQADYKASMDDVAYWKQQNIPFILLRVLRKESLVLWKLIEPETRSGIIKFSREDDLLDRAAAEKLARLVDDRYSRDSAEFKRRLTSIALEDADVEFDAGNYGESSRHSERAVRLARSADDSDLEAQAHLHWIRASLNGLIGMPEGRESAPAQRWRESLSAVELLGARVGERLLLEAQVGFFLKEYSAVPSLLERAHSANQEGKFDAGILRLSLQLLRPSIAGSIPNPQHRLEIEEQRLYTLLPKITHGHGATGVLLLSSLVAVRMELGLPLEPHVSALRDASEQLVDEDELSVVLMDLEALAFFLCSQGRADLGLTIGRLAWSAAERLGSLPQLGRAADLLARLLVKEGKDGTGSEGASTIEEAVAIRKKVQSAILRESGQVRTLRGRSLELYVQQWANRIQEEFWLLTSQTTEHSVERWMCLNSDCESLVSIYDKRSPEMRGDCDGLKAFLLSLQADVAARLGRVAEAAELFGRSLEVATEAGTLPTPFLVRLSLETGYFLGTSGDHTKADEILDRAVPFLDDENQKADWARHKEMVASIRAGSEWMDSIAAKEITAAAQETGVRTAIAPTIRRLLHHWDDLPSGCEGESPVLYDYWGRGGFLRIAAGVRGCPNDVIAVDATSVGDIERAAQVLCPLFEVVLVKWKGPMDQGVAVAEVMIGRDRDWLCGGGFVHCAQRREGWYPIVGYTNALPYPVIEFLRGSARPLIESGRLVVVPAVLVGCAQASVGWSDELLLSKLLHGVVIGVGSGNIYRKARTLNLAAVTLPYMVGDSLSLPDLAMALDDLGDAVTPFRRRIMQLLALKQLDSRNWPGLEEVRLGINEAIADMRSLLNQHTRNTSVRVEDLPLNVDAAKRSDHVGRAWVTEALQGIVGCHPELKPWVLFWRLSELGGYLSWSEPPTLAEAMGQEGEMATTWLSPPTIGPGVILARRLPLG